MEDADDGEVRGEIGMLHVAQAICGGVNRAVEKNLRRHVNLLGINESQTAS